MKNDLKAIGAVFRKDEMDYLELTETIAKYKNIIDGLSDVNIETDNKFNDVHFDNGMALGTVWAAMCLTDMVRTKMFIKGLFDAIEDHRTKTEGITHILYAGTGPYATLILPVLASYNPQEVKCTLLEINDESFAHVQEMISKLGFHDAIVSFVKGDATQVQLVNPLDIDIVITETMQRSLEREQQVPITINLLNQLRDDVILIPQKINVVACVLDNSKLDESKEEIDYCERLGSIIELSQSSLKSESYKVKENNELHFPEKTIELKKSTPPNFNQLVLLTEIQVYKNTWIRPYQSGLTLPKILEQLPPENTKDRKFKMQYLVDKDPKIVVTELK